MDAPLTLTDVPCPDDVGTAEPPVAACPVGGCPADRTVLARTVLRVERARWDAPPGSAVTLTPRPVPTRPVGDLRADSTALRCAPGTRDVGVRAGYVDGRRVAVRLCAVPHLPSSGAESTASSRYHVPGARGRAVVNARISGAVRALVEAARREGLRLSANSSFRTMRHQRDLCREDPGCRRGDHTLVAPPGHSQHQLGVAVDFSGTRVTGGRSCDRRAEDPASRVWRFLRRHAARFGFRQYAAESWHWDALSAPGRCGDPVTPRRPRAASTPPAR
ncbi:D-alanyl-D-alanine carboxypeptidase family protein [Nocardioides sp. TF02-7]|uniref:D-alanyl-D-alanine carboxypeptidase family protein n=1 Tax=Nocardioides sp. TF02-7 TaxID=2917724 RepID=UPI001F065548|nr:D-alanyl-D-alanine carboxypeptidase family protein [Nocardioides sp. TF02-7]UMG91846.1 D-alanyl-D-alanine carboxypeptidase family protein [Nocardioides sp. TF02-7]